MHWKLSHLGFIAASFIGTLLSLGWSGCESEDARNSARYNRKTQDALAVIAEGKDQQALANIAISDLADWIAINAVAEITDQKLLSMIAHNGKWYTTRAHATARLTDAALLAKFAVEDLDDTVRKAATEQLKDESLLAKIAVQDKEEIVCKAAVGKMQDQAMLARVAKETGSRDIRALAAEKITNEVLAKIATDPAENAAFEEALHARTVNALSGFIKRYPDSLRVQRALAQIWRCLEVEHPHTVFICVIAGHQDEVDLSRENGYDPFGRRLVAAVRKHEPFVVAFLERDAVGPFTVAFRELAGTKALFSELAPFVITPKNEGYYSRDLRRCNVSIPPYGKGSYTWSASFYPPGSKVQLVFAGANTETLEVHKIAR